MLDNITGAREYLRTVRASAPRVAAASGEVLVAVGTGLVLAALDDRLDTVTMQGREYGLDPEDADVLLAAALTHLAPKAAGAVVGRILDRDLEAGARELEATFAEAGVPIRRHSKP
ncbi:hypothetical protein ACWFQT_20350 [Cellulosimicrobium cellulans]